MWKWVLFSNPVQDGAVDDGSDEDGETLEEGAEDPNSAAAPGFLSSTWSFIITFFMSLIPEGPQNAANWTKGNTFTYFFEKRKHILPV